MNLQLDPLEMVLETLCLAHPQPRRGEKVYPGLCPAKLAEKPRSSSLCSIEPIVTIEPMTATTLTISDDLKKELLKVAAALQAAREEKVDYDEVLRYLVRKGMRNLALSAKLTARHGSHP